MFDEPGADRVLPPPVGAGAGTSSLTANQDSGGGAGMTGPFQGGQPATLPLVPVVTAPRGAAILSRDGQASFRFVMHRFEGIDRKQEAVDLGELQAVTIQNLFTDEQNLRKRGGSVDVSTSGTSTVIALHEAASQREQLLNAMDSSTGWVASDAANWTLSADTAFYVEGAGSLRLDAAGSGANGDTLIYDKGAPGWDLSPYDYVETIMEGTTGTAYVYFGVSEDNVTYVEAPGYNMNSSSTGINTWRTVRADISNLANTSKDAVRYLRYRYLNNSDSSARVLHADTVKAVKRGTHLLRAIVQSGTSPTGGPRDNPGLMTFSVQSNANSAWTSIGTYTAPANTKPRMVEWKGVTYVTMGQAGTAKFITGNLQAWTAPPSQFIEIHLEKLWLWSQDYDEHALRHSDLDTDDVWPTATDPTGLDGGLIYVGRQYTYFPTGMKSALGNLFLFTEGDLWILFGSDNSNFYLQRAHPGCGTLSNESIVRSDDGLIWHDGLHDRVLQWQGGNVVDIGDPIRPLLEAIPAARKPWTAAVWDGRFYYFSYAVAGGTLNTQCVVYDALVRRWHGPFTGDWTGFHASLIGSSDGLKYVGGTGVRKFFSGTGDNGTTGIALAWKSRAHDFRAARWIKRIRRAWVRAANTSATVTMNFYRDYEASPVRSYSLAFTGQPMEVQRVGVHNDVRAETVQIELTESSTSGVTIMEVGLDGHYIRPSR